MKNHDGLCRLIDKKISSLNKKSVTEYQKKLKEGFNIPEEVANEYLSMRSHIMNANDFILFAFATYLYNGKPSDYFSASEIKEYGKSKFVVDKLSFPLNFKMVQVADDQWIGKITVKELMKLRDAQVINYNENTQRTMQRVVAGGVEHWRITVNQTAVRGITDSFAREAYIPNTLTLNLPDDANYSYDSTSNTLSVRKSKDFKFDILDGYHRYLAISKRFNLNPQFDYDMELRIVQFDEVKAKQFIWQEDQKTKMKRADSESYNQSAIGTKVIARLNGSPTFNLAGEIRTNGGIIDSSLLYVCLNTMFVKPKLSKKEELSTILNITHKLEELINYLTETDDSYLKRWDKKTIIAVMYACYKDINFKSIKKEIKAYKKILEEHPNLLAHYQTATVKLTKRDFQTLDSYRAERE